MKCSPSLRESVIGEKLELLDQPFQEPFKARLCTSTKSGR